MYYILGFYRPNNKTEKLKYFVAKIMDDNLVEFRYMNEKKYSYHRSARNLEIRGYTKKAFEWSYIGCTLDEVKAKDNSLASLWQSINPEDEVPPETAEEKREFVNKLFEDMNNKIDDYIKNEKINDEYKNKLKEMLSLIKNKKYEE